MQGQSDSIETIEQPLHLRLRYNAGPDGLHHKLLSKLNEMRRASDDHISTRRETWARIDARDRGFIDLRAMARRGDGESSSTHMEMPYERAVVVPLSTAMMDVRKSQFMSIQNSRDPQHQLRPAGGTTTREARAMESNLAYDLCRARWVPTQNTFFRDCDRYGEGTLYVSWHRDFGMKLKAPVCKGFDGWVEKYGKMIPPMLHQKMFEVTKAIYPQLFRPERTWDLRAEFNRPQVIDPVNVIRDPRSPSHDPNLAEFRGHTEYAQWADIWNNRMIGDDASTGIFFNLEEAKKIATGKAGEGNASKTEKPVDRTHTRVYNGDCGTLKLDWITWRCIPKDHELDGSDNVEMYQFCVSNEAVIIAAFPFENDHQKHPYVCGESVPDMHALWNPGGAEQIDGVQRIVDFQYNTFAEYLRKALHSAGLVHPSLVNIEDILYPTPGGHIQVTDAVAKAVLAGKMSLGGAFQELNWDSSATSGNLEAAMWIYDFGMKLMATNDPQQGMPTESKRTLGEVQAIMSSSSARVAALARVIDAQAIEPLVEMMIANLQQYMTVERFVNVIGDAQKEFGGAEQVAIRPDDIYGQFDYVPIDGTLPMDPARQADSLLTLIQTAGGVPVLNGQVPMSDGSMVQFNYLRAVQELARILGFTDSDDFLEVIPPMPMNVPPGMAAGGPPGVVPDEQFDAQVQAGNFVPPEAM